MRYLIALIVTVTLALPVSAEDYRCQSDDGCMARINDDGELDEVEFRKGDIVSTEDGWVVSLDDGWEKIPLKKCSRVAAAYLWNGDEHLLLGLTTRSAVGLHGGWRREMPRLICLVGRDPR